MLASRRPRGAGLGGEELSTPTDPGPDVRHKAREMTTLRIAAGSLVALAIGTCLVLGTFGWLVVGFGVMTDCTNEYSCSTTSCSPCRTTGLWINVGGLGQLLLAAVGVGVLVRGLRTRRSGYMAVGGVALLVSSVLIVVGTTWLAESSYCRPGTADYRSSYCSTED